jgi:hypothetical protein
MTGSRPPSADFTGKRALSLLRQHGAMLQAGRGPLPSLAEAIAGEPIRGSWWGHPAGKLIYRVLEELYESPEVISCKLVEGKVTLIHRRLWPAILRLVPQRRGPALDRALQEHTASGAHRSVTQLYPSWISAEARAEAATLSEAEARALLGSLAPALDAALSAIGAAVSASRPSRKGAARRPSAPKPARRPKT